ncbi:hypothetical protein TSUD_66610 [Trifolium subterraneum]|uniref:Pentatricopeptide repeat-containing protein n=1 Tax=Trifolium subterraneum TaxID=3900 RepID=A0A2Z6MMU2_TRISU|nr:hypothetical protein TSUD_66610 [Trifolium subterraneum]
MARFRLRRTSFCHVSSFSSISFKPHLQNENFSDTKQQLTTLCSKGHIKQAFENFIYEIWTQPRQQVHAYVVKCGFEFNLVVGCSLAHMYMKAGSLRDGERIIKWMPNCNLVAWNTLMAGKAQNRI